MAKQQIDYTGKALARLGHSLLSKLKQFIWISASFDTGVYLVVIAGMSNIS